MSNILITGSSGLLGSSLVKKLSAESHVLYCISRNNKFLGNNIHPINVDLSSDFDIQQLPDEIDIIYHLAQSDRFREFPDGAMDVFNVNIHSTAKLLEYARTTGIKKFIYASSGGVYGTSVSPFHENSPINPPGALGYYLGSKACSKF